MLNDIRYIYSDAIQCNESNVTPWIAEHHRRTRHLIVAMYDDGLNPIFTDEICRSRLRENCNKRSKEIKRLANYRGATCEVCGKPITNKSKRCMKHKYAKNMAIDTQD